MIKEYGNWFEWKLSQMNKKNSGYFRMRRLLRMYKIISILK
jgi:hypothetical protein